MTFEGLDGSGKSTHLRRAAQRCEELGLSPLVTHEPGGTPFGEEVRRLFLGHRAEVVDGRVEALLVFASRRQHLQEVVEPALAAGQVVLCDRFTDSTVAYQGHGRGLELDWILALDGLATGGRQPDLTLLFDLPAEEARARGNSAKRRSEAGGVDRLDAENLAFYERVRQGYLELAERQPQRVRRVDSSGEHERTWQQVVAVLDPVLGVSLGATRNAG